MQHSTPTATTAQTTLFTLHPTVAQDDRSPRQRWQDGFDAYCRGALLEDLYDPYEIRGYWAANKGEALAGNPAYANQMGW